MPKRFLRHLAWLLVLAVFIPPAVQAAQTNLTRQDGSGYVISYVVDGDSLWVRRATGSAQGSTGRKQRLNLRLRGIDAPELCQRSGMQARAALRALAPIGQRVRVIVRARDRYGRAIADVILIPDGLNLSRQMAAQGWAWSNDRGSRGLYAREHQQAMQARRGLFAQEGIEHPANFRRRHGPCNTAGKLRRERFQQLKKSRDLLREAGSAATSGGKHP